MPDAAFWQIARASGRDVRRPHVLPLVGLAREVHPRPSWPGPRASDSVFAGRFARGMGRNAMSQALNRVLDGLGDEGASLKRDKPRPHDLRRSAISGMARIGISSRRSGWRSRATRYGDAHAVYDRHDRLDREARGAAGAGTPTFAGSSPISRRTAPRWSRCDRRCCDGNAEEEAEEAEARPVTASLVQIRQGIHGP